MSLLDPINLPLLPLELRSLTPQYLLHHDTNHIIFIYMIYSRLPHSLLSAAMRVIGSRTTSGQWNSFSAVSKNQQHVKRGNGMSLKPDLVAAASKGKKEESASEMTSDAVAVTKPVRKRAKTKDSKESETKESEAALSTRPSALTPSPPVAVPFDAASLLKNAPPSESWHKPRYWVCFTDLHLSAKTSAICIEVLQRVHQEAVSRQGGIVFLGDFWDERGRAELHHPQ